MSQFVYVCDCNDNDPLILGEDDARIRLAEDDGTDEGEVLASAPVVPRTEEEAKAFAAVLGWQVSYDGGRLTLIPSFDK